MKHTRFELQRLVNRVNNLNNVCEKGFIYLLTMKSQPTWYKIGKTSDLDKRLGSYKTHYPFDDVEYIKTYPCENITKSEMLAVFHLSKSCEDRKRNEWFKFKNVEQLTSIIEFIIDKDISVLDLFDYKMMYKESYA